MSWCFGLYTPLILLLLLGLPFFIFLMVAYNKFTNSQTKQRLTHVFLIAFFLTFVTHLTFVLLSFILQPIFACRIF